MNPPQDLISLAAESERVGDFERALQLYSQALERHPQDAQIWACLGRLSLALGRTDEAERYYEHAAEAQPDDPDLLCELGLLWMHHGKLAEAVACYERALSLRPDSVTAHNNLGLAFLSRHQPSEARQCFQHALALRPDLAALYNNLGLALLNEGQSEQALEQFEEAIRLQPGLADAHNNRGLALETQGGQDAAVVSFEQAVKVDPDHVGALANLGNALKDQGRAAEATVAYRRALELQPQDATVHSNLLLVMQYSPDVEPDEILSEARRYARQHAGRLGGEIATRARRNVAERLRVGYVSADLRAHPVAHFLEPILAAHDRDRFEIFCYSDVTQPDAVTARLQAHAEHWRSLVGLSDVQAAEMIREDGITILIDLAGHTAGNRLLCFARKPAPVQASYLGYLGTTGLRTMDYHVTDDHADPPGVTDRHYQEQLIRLPDCALCYLPGPTPVIAPEPPAERSGRVTFGCLNNPAKLTDQVLALWSEVLVSVPGSRLVVASGGSQTVEERVRAQIEKRRGLAERLYFSGRARRRLEYLDLYRTIDIALDPYPYNGVTTTCDALWMGVPVISLAGATSVSRQGVRFLRAVGLEELLASSPEEYVRIAEELAGNLPRLAGLHSGLRGRMGRSPLLDSQRLARQLEAAYLNLCESTLVGS
jgi:predicted O-linked N-acetylglucosamine transferase (SPINDLY family)